MNRRKPYGFTLLEMLLAAALTAGLVTGLLVAAGRAVEAWERSVGRVEAGRKGQRILDQLESDLACAGRGEPGGVWLAIRLGSPPQGSSVRLGGANVGEDRYGPGVLTLTMATRNQSLGRATETPLPVVASYRIERLSFGVGTDPRYMLCRQEADPSASFLSGFDLAAETSTASGADPAAQGNSATRATLRTVLAIDVVDFGLRVVAGRQVVFPTSEGPTEFVLRDGAVDQRPLAVEAMVRVLSGRGATEIAAIESNRLPGDWWRSAEVDSVVVTRQIRLGWQEP
ncbi:MAG: hypothetical protein JSR48_07695 [Verrucomicrobia bacterium]|nr:hypothetical protein [Verrucomicrobiota bacterium]